MAALSLCAPARSQDPVIKVNVRLVRMLVTVKDPAGQLVGSLNKSDFTVFDNDVKQDIAVFDRETEQPLSVAMLVDTSASTGIELHYELDSVSRFLRVLLSEGNPDDTVALYSFNWEVRLLSSYTKRFGRVDQMLKQLKSQGGTSLYDAIFLASHELEYRKGRHVMVLVTDGGDTTSSVNYHQALEAAQLADTIMYPVLVVPITNDAGRNVGGENALTTFSLRTGGRVFSPTLGAEMDNAFDQILRDLRTQYLLGFYPKDVPLTSDRFHTLQLGTKDPALHVVARSGYYGEAQQDAVPAYAGSSTGPAGQAQNGETVRPKKPPPAKVKGP